MVFALIHPRQNLNKLLSQIITATGDYDDKLGVKYQVGSWIQFSDSLAQLGFFSNAAYLSYDPPGDFLRPEPGPSQHSYFDGGNLSDRPADYQDTVVGFFAEIVLHNFLQESAYVVEPDADVIAALNGRLPKSLDDIVAMVQANPSLLAKVQRIQSGFELCDLSVGARKIIRALLENSASLERYLASPQQFVASYTEGGVDIREIEISALVRAANERKEFVRNAFDSVELGRASGDGNVYILIGVDRETNLPDSDGLGWYQLHLADFVQANHFLPGFGYFVTEAMLRFTVIAGPGVTDREMSFLTFGGHTVADLRDGRSFGYALSEILNPPSLK